MVGAIVGLAAGAAAGLAAFGPDPFDADRVRALRSALIGAVLGFAGAFAILASMNWCMFGVEDDAVQAVLGVALAGASGFLVSGGAKAIFGGGGGSLAEGDFRSGAYRLGWWWPWLLLAPTLVVLVFFLYWPAIQTFRLSTKLTRLGAPRQADKCLANFSDLLVPQAVLVAGLPIVAVLVIAGVNWWCRHSDPLSASHRAAEAIRPFGIVAVLAALYWMTENENGGYRQIYVNTLVISAGTVALAMVFGLALAYLTYRRLRGISVYRTLLIWPYAISPPVAGILFFMLFNATGGVVAAINARWGLGIPNYAENAILARFVVVIASVWKLLGYNMLFFLAGLQTVPRDQVEAAALDGAGSWQRFRHIVMPALGPIAFFLLVTNLTYSFFDIYGTIDFLTKGAPAGATSVAIYEIIRVGIDNGDLGRGAAQSVVLFLAVIGLTVWQFRRSEDVVSYGGA